MGSERDLFEESQEHDEDLPGYADVAAYLDSLSLERNCSEHTIRNYRIDLCDFLRWANRRELDPYGISHKQARRYLGELDAAKYTRATINRRLSSLKGFFAWLNQTGRIDANPVCALQGPKRAERLPHTVSVDDMVKILSVHDRHAKARSSKAESDEDASSASENKLDLAKEVRDQAILELMYACGLRISEIATLLAKNVDFKLGQVKVLGKGSKERIVPMHDLAISEMREYWENARDVLLDGKSSEFFFVSNRGNEYSADAIRKMFKATLASAGVDLSITPHSMRHAFATDLLSGGADLRSVQEMLGHASLSTTQIYTHISPERLSEIHHQAHPRG